MYFETRNRFIIALAWGPRRMTSSRRYGELESAYPSQVGTGHRLWLRWFRNGIYRWLTWKVRIVVPASRANARILSAIEGIPPPQPVLEKSEIEALLLRRVDLRKKRDFTEADKIRDQLTEAGVDVRDHAIP